MNRVVAVVNQFCSVDTEGEGKIAADGPARMCERQTKTPHILRIGENILVLYSCDPYVCVCLRCLCLWGDTMCLHFNLFLTFQHVYAVIQFLVEIHSRTIFA